MEKAGGISVVNSNLAYKDIETEIPQIKDEQIKWCSVSLSDVIARGKRLEASVFDVEAKQAWQTVINNRFGIKYLGTSNGLIDNAYYPGRFKRIYCSKGNGVAFYLPSQMTDVYPKPDKFISKITKCSIDELRLKAQTLLLTRSGTIGKISYVSKTLADTVFSDDVIRVTFKDDVDLGYTYTFLKSPVGQKILTTNGYGSVITHIEPEHLDEIPIPNAPNDIKQRINNLIIDSYRLRDESNELIDNATQLLVDELHLPDIGEFKINDYKEESPVETFSVKLSKLNGRADASYHLPIVEAIIEHLEKHAAELTTVGDSRVTKDIVLAGVFKRTYVDEKYGYPFLGGKEITQLAPKTEKFLSKAIHKKRYEKELKVEENTVLVTDRGTIGTVAIVPKHWNSYAVSQNVLKAVPSTNEIAGYLFIYLNSDYGRLLVQRQTYGSVVDMIDNNSLSSVEIPLLRNKDVQKKINDLALEANQKRYEAYNLEQQALEIMDKEVIFAK